jgi:hypothetical protein
MTQKIHLGVIDLPYVNAPKKGQKKTTGSTVTTGQVAEWLERDYHILETFAARNLQGIADDMAKSIEGGMENLLMGAPLSTNVFGAAESSIENRAKKFISDGVMDTLGIPGVPTQAAKDRAAGKARSSRRKNKRASNAKPVSFIDTGLYQGSIKAWVE